MDTVVIILVIIMVGAYVAAFVLDTMDRRDLEKEFGWAKCPRCYPDHKCELHSS